MQPKSTFKRIAGVAGAGALALGSLTGCQSPDPVRAPYTPAQDLLPLSAWPNVITHGPTPLRIPPDGISVRYPDERQTMKVVAAIRNVADEYVYVRYRVLFYDAGGSQTTRNPIWRETGFPPRGPSQIEATAISLEAVDYRIEIAPI